MPRYPEEITEEVLNKTDHISDSEVRRDIADTKTEIENMTKEAEGHKLIAESNMGTPKGKMHNFRWYAARNGIKERRGFVAFLERLLEARNDL